MLKTIIKEYGDILKSTLKIITLLLCCIVIGAVFVFPLWKFASVFPKAYSITIMSVFALAAVFLIIMRLRESGAKAFVFGLLKFLIIAAAVFLCIFFVMKGMRILAVPSIILMIILYGICTFVSRRWQ